MSNTAAAPHCSQVQVQGPAPTPVTAGAVKAAVHSYAYCARTTGQYVISATIDGVHMRGSPASVTASTAEAHAPLCEVRGAPLTLSTIAGATIPLTSSVCLRWCLGTASLFQPSTRSSAS